ncbi:uncharacterized protein [Spinacia oleracea]|uniref:Retrotransposon gag domain-containing protein n=1 Tax=Spinacia oleracea TaxID=3562 RepID=A0ABM3R409_SPIOL|nr:uncharacterized protein LOC110803285 [Spinacia oleracea]
MANQGIADVVRKLFEVVQNLAQVRNNPVIDPAGEIFKKVAQSKPPLYQGEVYPSILENWLREFDNVIVAVNFPQNLRVNSVVYYVMGEADLWWQRCEETLRATPNFGWKWFKFALRNKFYPPYLKNMKSQEFIELRMDGLSVTDYYSKFIELSRFEPEEVATKELRA